MNKKVGERIKELRNKMNLTQAELAEKSGFTPQTVSNWESGSREPDIDTLVKLSSLFSVSLDYLISGKEQEKEVIIMSRIEMAAKKDDPSIIQDLSFSTNYTKDENGKCIMDYIIQYNSKKVFEVMFKSCSHQTHYDVLFNCEYFNKSQNRNLKIIEYLLSFGKEREFVKSYGLGEIRLLNEFAPNFINQRSYNSKAKEELLESYKNIFKYLVDNYSKLSDERRDYYFASGQEKADRKNCWSYAFPCFLDFAVKAKNDSLMKYLIKRMEEGLSAYDARFKDMRSQGYSENQIYRDCQYMFTERPLEETYQYVMQNSLFDYARMINKLLAKPHPEKELKLAEMKNDANVDVRETLKYEFTKDYILRFREMLSADVVIPGIDKEANKDKYLETLLKKYKSVYSDVINNSSLSFLELAYRGVANNDLSEFYKFVMDNNFVKLRDMVLMGDSQKLLAYLVNVFVIKSEEIREQPINNRYDLKEKNVYRGIYERNRNGEMYVDDSLFELVQEQYKVGVLPIDIEFPSDVKKGVEYFDNFKKEVMSQWESDIESRIASRQARMKVEKEYHKVKEEFTDEYLKNLINKNDEEKATIKLCVKLEAVLKFKYSYEGDLFTMLDKFFEEHCKLYNPYDDYDNNYNWQLAEDEKHKKWMDLLQKLRMKRNSIVHSERANVELSREELIDCIQIINEIEGE
ncbi:MAG: helix-turn-helix transcriptional regulator [Candidatus Enterosoma sp.]|nr:helix-turn-helix transcriptional regulator [bacterium]MDY5865712.1 helix-turn-helix transcriptional regulator [Candidatus Enterosoma sp.]